jgi:hypothetical protein
MQVVLCMLCASQASLASLKMYKSIECIQKKVYTNSREMSKDVQTLQHAALHKQTASTGSCQQGVPEPPSRPDTNCFCSRCATLFVTNRSGSLRFGAAWDLASGTPCVDEYKQ